jgi:hypothetical protein
MFQPFLISTDVGVSSSSQLSLNDTGTATPVPLFHSASHVSQPTRRWASESNMAAQSHQAVPSVARFGSLVNNTVLATSAPSNPTWTCDLETLIVRLLFGQDSLSLLGLEQKSKIRQAMQYALRILGR